MTLRSIVVTLVALLLMGIWIEYEELYLRYGGPLAENSPPNSAVGVMLGVMMLSVALGWLRRPLRLSSRELVVVYVALIVAAPLMTQGLWHRLFGLIAAIPHNQDFKSYDSLPSLLWPHGPNLIPNARFENGLAPFVHEGGGHVVWTNAPGDTKRSIPRVLLSHGGDSTPECSLAITLKRFNERAREQLVPGECYLFSALVRTEGFTKGSGYLVIMRSDGGTERTLLASSEETRPSLARPDGFSRIGISPVRVPGDLRECLTLVLVLRGQGSLAVREMEFLNIEAIEGLYAGRRLIREEHLEKLGPNERDFTVVRPRRLWGLQGFRYLLSGLIPLEQWREPALAWTALIGGLFLGFLGLNLLMRKQWADHERFTFPLTILPKRLFEEDSDGFVLFRNRLMWTGFACTLPLVISKGIQFYYPEFPSPAGLGGVRLANHVNSPVLKAFLADVGIGTGIGVGMSFVVLAISLLVETDVLFSLWSMFFLFQLWNLFGKLFNWTAIPGYPWKHQQNMGAFIAYALLAVVIGRHHLAHYLRCLIRGSSDVSGGSAEATAEVRWAVFLIALSLASIGLWGVWTRMGAGAALLFFGYMLVCGFAASKIRAEMGAPFGYLTPYFGMQFAGAMGGFAVFGTRGMLVAAIASGFMCTSCFLITSPVQVEMLDLGRHFSVRKRDVVTALLLGLLGGLFIGGFVVLCWAYGLGANNLQTSWPYEQNWYFSGYRVGEVNADRAVAAGTLHTTPENRPMDLRHNVDAKGLGIGFLITVALAALRAKFTWFPFHPLGYVLAPTFFMQGCWFSLLVAWGVRRLLFRIGGARVIRHGLVPFCVGMFLAGVVSVVLFDVVGVLLQISGVTEVYSKLP